PRERVFVPRLTAPRPPPSPPLFPYTTLFRSGRARSGHGRDGVHVALGDADDVSEMPQHLLGEREVLLVGVSAGADPGDALAHDRDRKSTRLNSSHLGISYAVFCLKKKTTYTC